MSYMNEYREREQRMNELDIGVVGLAVMGRSLALNMAEHGIRVGGYNRGRGPIDVLAAREHSENLSLFYSLEELIPALKRPRRILLMVKAGDAVDKVIAQLLPLLEEGDILMDGGNSFFEDTRRRERELRGKGIYFFGVGVSGGEEGALRGPAIMPGGDRAVYQAIRPILEAISAKAEDGAPCCTYMGPDGAGHYVKMVHNGIEYADMQLIAESYLLLKTVGGYSNLEMADIFARWNLGELKSYLVGITADVLRETDDLAPGELVDHIEDSAQQKGTGRWTSLEALRLGVNTSLLTQAVNARIQSNQLAQRGQAAKLFHAPEIRSAEDRAAFAERVREALYTAKITAYAQGFALLREASEVYGWELDLGGIASVFRAGCIIKAAFLNDITRAFRTAPGLTNLMLDSFFGGRVDAGQTALRESCALGVLSGVPLPAMGAAAAYLDAFRGTNVGANLIQAQRDYFGAHTYGRTDREGVFHHTWGRKYGE